MDSLIQDLQKTIEALEMLGDKMPPAREHLDELLDQLFQQKIDLVNATLNTSSQPYHHASQAIKQAAAKSVGAAKDPAQIAGMSKSVSDAIAKLAKLLDSVSPIA